MVEVSNPLTTTDISQESPVGSVISYMGTTAPEHYLPCDGGTYNIADYQTLADFIKQEFGMYNIYGGDGITTFALPNTVKNTDKTPTMTANNAPSPYAVLASGEYSTTYPAWKAFNNSNSSMSDCWAGTNEAISGWIQIDLNRITPINYFTLTSRNESTATTISPKVFCLQGSNDGTNFITIKSYDEPVWGINEKRTFNLDKTVAYRYYRITISTNHGGNYTAIGEIRLFRQEISFIKAEPTYYAVNQYGGFESKVLFDGLAFAVQGTNYNLLDSLENYDFLIIYTGASGGALNSQMFDVNYIKSHYGTYEMYDSSMFHSTSTYWRTCYNFVNKTSFTMQWESYSTWARPSISKIIGIKGAIPTLLTGGAF
jgi:microcystin-dependent protein